MKKTFIIILLAALVVVTWLILHQPKLRPSPALAVPQPITVPATNAQISAQTPTNLSPALLFPAPSTNAPVRPNSVDEETWSRWIAYRQFILEQNPPVEFYARVVDQDGQPVEGAKLTLKLTRMEGMSFATTNFSAWDPAKAIQDTYLTLYSDANGWIRLTGVTGRTLRVETLTKEGLSFVMPEIGSFGYSPERAVGYAGMEDAFNPDKGYVFHLTKN
jgi:hypothetical protein